MAWREHAGTLLPFVQTMAWRNGEKKYVKALVPPAGQKARQARRACNRVTSSPRTFAIFIVLVITDWEKAKGAAAVFFYYSWHRMRRVLIYLPRSVTHCAGTEASALAISGIPTRELRSRDYQNLKKDCEDRPALLVPRKRDHAPGP